VKYALDTNIFVDALRSDESAAKLDSFLNRMIGVTFLSAVVIQELRAGADSARRRRHVERAVFRPFERRGRVFAPSTSAFNSGRLLEELARRKGADFVRANRSLANDALLAASCRERAITLISRDKAFECFQPSLGRWRAVAPWP
jgi:predicted nucleic acid-binding protein